MTEHPIPTVSALEPGAHQQPNSQPEAAAQPQPQTQNVMLEAALYYGARGWPVFQLHGMTAVGGCTCGHPHKKEKDKAKHPVKTGGYHNGTTDPVIIKSVMARCRSRLKISQGVAIICSFSIQKIAASAVGRVKTSALIVAGMMVTSLHHLALTSAAQFMDGMTFLYQSLKLRHG